MDRKYIIVGGYWNRPDGWRGPDGCEFRKEFFKIWYDNTLKYSKPKAIYTIDGGSSIFPEEKLGEWINVFDNNPHGHDNRKLLNPRKFNGWSCVLLMGALLAYSNNCDLIFKEQDCLAFNGWIEKAYQEMERANLQMLIGTESFPGLLIEQSLVIIKNSFLLDFITTYLSIDGLDDCANMFQRKLTEHKFAELQSKFPYQVGLLSFGYGRARPVSLDKEKVFYIQQVTKEEVIKLKEIGLI